MASLSLWTADHLSGIAPDYDRAPVITGSDVLRVADDLDIWDAWPIQLRDGVPMRLAGETGGEVWMALGAARFPDPDERHGHARIHLFRRDTEGRDTAGWVALGPAMPDGFSPGSREWSGSAIYDPEDNRVTLYFTAAGRRGETALSFEQRLFSAHATMLSDGQCADWRDLTEVMVLDERHYMSTCVEGQIGTIKAFRDPFYFRDPATGAHYLFFAGSLAGSASAYNGVVGVAVARSDQPDEWHLLPPVLSADTLNNELERPHVVVQGGRYYLFWATQHHVFNPQAIQGPTGLYGMVADSIDGPWHPLNGSGLVFANPDEAPAQAYSWMVLPDLSVTSFVDNWGGGAERRFGGCFAPFLHLELDGKRAMLKGGGHGT